MTEPLRVVARVAATPEQAKIFVALLQAEGIPAHVDGDSLVDEFAMSRRLLNMIGVKVMVPASSLERAREILAPSEIDAEELEAQALAAAEQPPALDAAPPAPPAGLGGLVQMLLLIAVLLAICGWLLFSWRR